MLLEIAEILVELFDNFIIPLNFAMMDLEFDINVLDLLVLILGRLGFTSMKLVRSICLVLLAFLRSLALVISSLLVE